MITSDTLLPTVCLDEAHSHNTDYPVEGMVMEQAYFLLGEVAMEDDDGLSVSGIRHYVLLDPKTGMTIKGMLHGDRLRYVTQEDKFF